MKVALLLLLPSLAFGQVYRCGATYQSQPCDGGRQLEIRSTAPAVSQERAKAFCDTLLQARLKDPDSAKMDGDWRYIGAQRYDGQAALAWGRMVNAKNSFGGYTGEKPVVCYLSPDGERMLGLTGG